MICWNQRTRNRAAFEFGNAERLGFEAGSVAPISVHTLSDAKWRSNPYSSTGMNDWELTLHHAWRSGFDEGRARRRSDLALVAREELEASE